MGFGEIFVGARSQGAAKMLDRGACPDHGDQIAQVDGSGVRRDECFGSVPDARDGYACFHSPGARIGREELAACGAIARDHIRLARPERLILFGDAPCRALLNEPLARARGRIHRIEGVRTIATFHPRWLLQRPSDKALAWRDLLLLMSESE